VLISKTAQVFWNSRNKKYYVERGYSFTRMGDPFDVDISDLTPGSQAVVDVQCDYCGSTYTVVWYAYVAMKKRTLQTDCCKGCLERKALDAVNTKFGGHAGMFAASNASRKATNISRYGSANVFGSEEIKQRIVSSNLEKYGVPYSQQNKDVRHKTEQTCKEKYGVANYVELFKGKFIGENSPVWKGGVEYSRVERATHDYDVWRRTVFARDGYTCVRCGRKNGDGSRVELHAHHIKNWTDYPDERYDIENGVTLCDKCHYQFHSAYGKRHNSLEQFQTFMLSDKKVC
jgi:DNA-directed RNA polymerase subunit RPC12/RpoP